MPEQRTLERTDRLEELGFSPERLDELNRMGGPTAYDGEALGDLGPDLLGRDGNDAPPPLTISLHRAVTKAIEHNLALQSARLTPAIAQADVVSADAAFDWVFFADFSWNGTDEPSRVPVFNGVPVGVGASQNQAVAYTTGLRKALTTGGEFTISQGQTYFDDSTPGAAFAPDPSNQVNLTIGYAQPLLRNFGSDVALAQVRLSRNAERSAIQQTRQAIIDTITETERAYWALVDAERSYRILRRSLERGEETRDVLKARLKVDARPAEYSDAQATVERRRSDLIRAANTLRRASDRLKLLMNDPNLPIGSEVVLLPSDTPVEEPLTFSLFDALDTALRNRPDLARALLAIDDASIRQLVARNQTLPRLDFSIQAVAQGLDTDTGDAYDRIGEGDFINWALGLNFEQAIGNRAAEAGLRRSQLQRLQSVIEYERTRENAIEQVVAALRSVQEQYLLIEQTRTERVAAAENLRTLLALERTIANLDANFLNLKLQRQDNLARAELSELRAMIDYNLAVAELYRATGEAPVRNRVDVVVPDAGE
ncbi:MAG: TolC family protein [Phycisphaerales bacterium]